MTRTNEDMLKALKHCETIADARVISKNATVSLDLISWAISQVECLEKLGTLYIEQGVELNNITYANRVLSEENKKLREEIKDITLEELQRMEREE